MKSINFLLFFLLLLGSSSLKAVMFPGTLITLSGDSIAVKIDAGVGFFSGKSVNPTSIKKSVTMELAPGRIKKFKPTDIQGFIIHKTKEGSVAFLSKEVKNKQYFVKLIHQGSVNLYFFYTRHPYDGGLIARYFLETFDGEMVQLREFTWRKQLVELYQHVDFFNRERAEKQYRFGKLKDFFQDYERSLGKTQQNFYAWK
ncbi:hypothetical protein [Lewinella sp. W8]|uniref:hypothetical protein n=1 Tax=Lewinella sp. W8 TaxID=2528208 RepID=UPI00106752AB|nr:hypothetical protein [Lewinella sp. W8]MTB50528.1 hypothetical protein [Lewinella sp. W8]